MRGKPVYKRCPSTTRALSVSQSRASDPRRGKREKFSLDMLITLAIRADRHVDLHLAA